MKSDRGKKNNLRKKEKIHC